MSFAISICPLPFPSEEYLKQLDQGTLEQYSLNTWGEVTGGLNEGWDQASPDGRPNWLIATINFLIERVEDLMAEAEIEWFVVPISGHFCAVAGTDDRQDDSWVIDTMNSLAELPCYSDFWAQYREEVARYWESNGTATMPG